MCHQITALRLRAEASRDVHVAVILPSSLKGLNKLISCSTNGQFNGLNVGY
jgi:hypothetical protein